MEYHQFTAIIAAGNPDIPLIFSVRTNAGNPEAGRLSGRMEPRSRYPKGIMTQAILHTNHGDIVIELFEDHAPVTVANFIGLADGTKPYRDQASGQQMTSRFYDGLTFHRVISGFMLQGGDPRGDGRGGPGYEFADEFHPDLSFDRPYLLAMANAGPGTNGSQFFITVAKTPHLNRRHTIFGEVRDPASRQVVDAIAALPTDRHDRPRQPVVMETVEIIAD